MKKRRFLSLIVAMVMVMSTCLTAMASETDNTSLSAGTGDVVTNTETVTISEIPTDVDSLSLSTYQVLYATYDSTTNELTYHLTGWACTALSVTSGSADEKTMIANIQAITTDGSTTTEQTGIVNTLASYVISVKGTASAVTEYTDAKFTSWSYTSSSTSATATLPVGAYLVLPSAENMSFLNMLVSVDATAGTTANTWKTEAHDAVLKGKKNGITKYVEEGSIASGATTTAEDVQIGETVTYTVKVDVPQFAKDITNTNIIFKVVDDPDDGISIITGNTSTYSGIVVKALDGSSNPTLTYGTDYTVSVNSYGVLTVDLSTNYQTLFCADGAYPYTQVEITYSATVLSTAAVGTANTNTATLTYGHDGDENTAEATANVYTYELDLTKTDGSTGLAGAKFQILDSTGAAIRFTGDAGNYTVYDGTTGTPTDTLTVDSNGKIVIKGLDSDTEYYIHETTAPAGYSLNSNYLWFKITATTPGTIDDPSGVATQVYTAAPGTTQTETYDTAWTASKSADNNYTVTASLTDTEIPSMPSTGSIGIIIFTVLGVCLMIVAVFLMTSSKDSKKKQAQ